MAPDPDPGQSEGLLPLSAPPDTIARAPILIYKAGCLEKFAVSKDIVGHEPNLRYSLRADEAELVTHVISILDSKDAKEAVLSLEGDAAQCFIDVVQDILDRSFLMQREQSKKARHIIRKLSEVCDKLPSSLFVTGVGRNEEHPRFGGGFGNVYRASYKNETVALKVMHHFLPTSELRDIRLKICREALVWRDLHHPHILTFIGIDRETFPSLALVSPWMEHGTVLHYLDRHGRANVDKLDVWKYHNTVVQLFQIAQGIEHLHSRNIVHGDLKGANILINDDWTACLADFGLSAFTDVTSTRSSTQRAGSAYWMAPELIDPDRFNCKFVRTPATDVYAFACLYTGRPPFSELLDVVAMLRTLDGKRAQRPPGPPTMSDALWQNITEYWTADPAARPSSQIVAQKMVWPAFDEDDAPVVDEEAPVMGIDTRIWLYVFPRLSEDETEPNLSAGSSKNELKNNAPIEEEASKELRINAHTSNKMGSIEELTVKSILPLLKDAKTEPRQGSQITSNKMGSMEGEEELTVKSIIPLLKDAKIHEDHRSDMEAEGAKINKLLADPDAARNILLVQDSMSPQPSQVQLEDNNPETEAKTGPAVSAQTQEGPTAGLKKAIQYKAPTQTLVSFVQNGADVNVKADVPFGEPSTALHLGVSRGDKEFIAMLLGHGGDPNIKGGEGTAIYLASVNEAVEITEFLLQNGADPNIKGGEYGTALQAASMKNSVEILNLLLQNGADPNIEGGTYCTALEAASANGWLETVKLLLQSGADVNIQGGMDGSAVQAASEQSLDIVELLLAHGADVNIGGSLYGTALQAASAKGRVEIVKLLLQSGADVNTQGGQYHTALQAASTARLDIVELLLAHGADVNIEGGIYGTALQAACARGKVEIIKLLLDHGADMNIEGGYHGTALQCASAKGNVEIVKLLLDHGADMNIKGGFYDMVLAAAAVYGQLDVAKLLLDHGASVNIEGCTNPALRNAEGKLEVVKFVIEQGADLHIDLPYHGTPLCAASERGELEIVKYLIEHGADPNIHCSQGRALRHASTGGNLEVVKFLIEHGADPNIEEFYYGTPLCAASERGELEIVKYLIEHGADPNIQNFYDAPLHIASSRGDLEMVKYLIGHGADLNINHRQGTALKCASSHGKLEVVKFLIEHGADPNINDFAYGTPLHAASQSGELEIVKYLIENGADPKIRMRQGSKGTVVQLAQAAGKFEVVAFLKEQGAIAE
ncbi:ankyrin repeat-containing domain protein [Mycena galopus ATCC 62051]|nr:ankyrin repeat-containing domain protein [Mycena galopus ATCC 62051]